MEASIANNPANPKRPYGVVGGVLVALIATLVVVAYVGFPALGIFTVNSGLFGLATIALVLTVGLAYVLFTLRGSLDQMRERHSDFEARLAMLEKRNATPVVSVWTPFAQRKGAHAQRTRNTPVIAIDGISPTYEARLDEQGIQTIGELKAANPASLAAALRVAPDTLRQWQSMADLMELDQVGKQYAEILVRAGVASVDELAKTHAADLLQRIEATQATTDAGTVRLVMIQSTSIKPQRVTGWIAEAKRVA